MFPLTDKIQKLAKKAFDLFPQTDERFPTY